ncbi:MAG TPA: lysozyme inhibitor LprI family protein [Daejeonella sp.]|nr:lysozyme inhibitor LprI family protein [Daejeonella sp.]
MTSLKQVAVLVVVLMISGFQGRGQTRPTFAGVKSIERSYQLCLDKGINMLGCSMEYYSNVDSCLKDAYGNLMKELDSPQKDILEKEQDLWLKKRNIKFKIIDQENTMEGRDGQMIRRSEKADFVKARVLDLIRRGHN